MAIPPISTVWDPYGIQDATFAVGDQFVLTTNSTYDDAICIEQSVPPRLSFQAYSAPLDAKFAPDHSNLYVSFHGSWDKQPPRGFKLVAIPFQQAEDGPFEPVAAADSPAGYEDIWTNTDITRCSTTDCFRPVGIAVGGEGQLYVTSDANAEGELFVLGRA